MQQPATPGRFILRVRGVMAVFTSDKLIGRNNMVFALKDTDGCGSHRGLARRGDACANDARTATSPSSKTILRYVAGCAIAFLWFPGVIAHAADLEPVEAGAEQSKPADARPTIFGIPIGGATFPERYVPPLTNPLFNESPFITSEVRLVYAYHSIPDDFPSISPGGGNIQVIAGQICLKLTDRLALIATKDGFAFANFDSPLLGDENGFVNIAGGAKYALYENKETGSIITTGLRIEIPLQNLSTAGVQFQGAGDGFINPFITAATTLRGLGILDGVQLQGSAGANIAFDQDAETSIAHFSAHANYELFKNFYPLLEVNAFVPIEDGNRSIGPLAGLDGFDLANFGSSDRGTSVSVGGGFRYRFSDNAIFGAGAEVDVTNNNDSITDWRVTADFSFNF